MSIEELLECSAAQLQAMTDQELLEHFKPYLTVTRPEFAPRPKSTINAKVVATVNTKQFASKLEQLKALGIDISVNDFRKAGKRR